jgi:SSS family solute:Na+ symporter
VIGQKYDKKCHVVAGIISVGLCAGFAAVMAKAGGGVLRSVLIDIFNFPKEYTLPQWSSVAIVVGITALYTTFGGLRASVITDAFQFSAFATLLPITLIIALAFNLKGGATAFTNQAATATSEGLSSISTIEIIGFVVAWLLGETLIPPYANRALASKTTSVSRNGFLLAGFFSIVWFMVMISLGIVARNIVPGQTDEDIVLLQLVREIMPNFGYALLLVVLVSVVMSSLDSLLNAGAVAFTQDIIQPFVSLKNGQALSYGRAATIAIAIIAAICAVYVPSIIGGLLICYNIWAPAILPALIIGLFINNPRSLAGILSMSCGTVYAVLYEFVIETDIPAIIPALIAAISAYILGHLLGSPKTEE